MNSDNILKLAPIVSTPVVAAPEARIIMGLIPSHNQFLLSMISHTIMPGLVELAGMSMEEFTPGQIMFDILYGNKQLHMVYIDKTGTAVMENFQKEFAQRLQDPAKDYAGFSIIEPLRNTGFHIFCGYVTPEYRRSNVAKMAFRYLEQEARKMRAPYISTATPRIYTEGVGGVGLKETTVNFRKKLIYEGE
jgi:GNAT superfamily N-acetyltransferase